MLGQCNYTKKQNITINKIFFVFHFQIKNENFIFFFFIEGFYF